MGIDQKHPDGRQVGGAGDLVAGQIGVAHAAFRVEDHLLGERVADAVGDGSLHLPLGEPGVDRGAAIDGGDEVEHPHHAGLHVDGDLGEAGEERRRRLLGHKRGGGADLELVGAVVGPAAHLLEGDVPAVGGCGPLVAEGDVGGIDFEQGGGHGGDLALRHLGGALHCGTRHVGGR
jgi:hypothetical protein